MTSGRDAKRVVSDGYDAAAESYLADRPRAARDLAMLEVLTARLAPGGRVLDLGCGAGVPVMERLLDGGSRAVGLDLSMAQLRLAKDRVDARLAQGDMSALPFHAGSFDGVVAYYSIIHVPREGHEAIFDEIRRVLIPRGHALLVLGARDLSAAHDEDSWFGVPMYWSHYDVGTSLKLLSRAGLDVVSYDIVPDPMGHGEHLFAFVRSNRVVRDR